MRILASRSALRHFLRWTQRAFFAGGVVILGYCGFVLIDSWIFQQRAGEDLERRLSRERAARSASERPAELPPAVGADGLIGRIEIQRLGLSAIVFEGTDKTTLRRAAGHIPRTGFPGQPGNIGIAGHRDTFFRPLKDIAKEDVIVLTTLRGEFHYRVVWTRVVAPTEVSVLNPAEGEMLTLVTCYPFYFVGSAPERFIVRAERVIFGEAAVNGRQIPTSRPSVDRGRSRIRAQLRLRVCGPSVRRLCLGPLRPGGCELQYLHHLRLGYRAANSVDLGPRRGQIDTSHPQDPISVIGGHDPRCSLRERLSLLPKAPFGAYTVLVVHETGQSPRGADCRHGFARVANLGVSADDIRSCDLRWSRRAGKVGQLADLI